MSEVDGNYVIRYLTTRGRSIILEHFKPSSCIASTRIGLDVMKSLGFDVWPQAVRLEVFNHVVLDAWDAGHTGPITQEDYPEAKVVGVDGSGLWGNSEWDGHLVLMVRDDHGLEVLVDLSLDQFARPAFGLDLKPTAVPVAHGWPLCWTEGSPRWTALVRPIKSRSYRETKDWNRAEPIEAIVAEMLAEIRSGFFIPLSTGVDGSRRPQVSSGKASTTPRREP